MPRTNEDDSPFRNRAASVNVDCPGEKAKDELAQLILEKEADGLKTVPLTNVKTQRNGRLHVE